MANQKTETTVAKRETPVFDDNMLAAIDPATAWAELDALFAGAGVTVESIENYGTGFKVCKNASILVGVPFVFLQWREATGDYGTFIVAHIVTQDGRKLVLPNGSMKSGLGAQLANVTAKRIESGISPEKASAGLFAPNGLVESRYDYADPTTGELRPAVTYNIAE